jgi:hemolysin-activating ACP:hemolysin acyltransferase
VPRAFVSWAYLSEEAETRFLRGDRLTTQDWMSGDRLWLMDLVAPYGQGSAAKMVKAWHEAIPEGTNHYNVIRRHRKPNRARHFLGTRLPNGRWGSRLVRLVDLPKHSQAKTGI